MEVKYIDRAYAAGFIEADGCFHITNSGVGVRVTNKHVPTLEWFMDKFGGHLSSKGTPSNCWDWNLHGIKAVEFISDILPFLNMKTKEAYILLEFASTISSRGKKLSYEIKQKRDQLRKDLKEARRCR